MNNLNKKVTDRLSNNDFPLIINGDSLLSINGDSTLLINGDSRLNIKDEGTLKNGSIEIKKEKEKKSRFRYFTVKIMLGIEGPNVPLLFNDDSLIVNCFQACNFIKQLRLEEILYNFEIKEKKRTIRLTNFRGQLQKCEKTNTPCWNIVLETNYPTTSIFISRTIFKKLFSSENFGFIKKILKVKRTTELITLDEKQRLSIPNSDWAPGHFDKEQVAFFKMIQNPEIKTQLQNNRTLLEQLLELPN